MRNWASTNSREVGSVNVVGEVPIPMPVVLPCRRISRLPKMVVQLEMESMSLWVMSVTTPSCLPQSELPC